MEKKWLLCQERLNAGKFKLASVSSIRQSAALCAACDCKFLSFAGRTEVLRLSSVRRNVHLVAMTYRGVTARIPASWDSIVATVYII